MTTESTEVRDYHRRQELLAQKTSEANLESIQAVASWYRARASAFNGLAVLLAVVPLLAIGWSIWWWTK